jgi:hypothetical protein
MAALAVRTLSWQIRRESIEFFRDQRCTIVTSKPSPTLDRNTSGRSESAAAQGFPAISLTMLPCISRGREKFASQASAPSPPNKGCVQQERCGAKRGEATAGLLTKPLNLL